MAAALVLSLRIVGVLCISIFSSLSKELIHVSSVVHRVIALYSDSAVDLATKPYFLELQAMRFPPRNT